MNPAKQSKARPKENRFKSRRLDSVQLEVLDLITQIDNLKFLILGMKEVEGKKRKLKPNS